MRHRALCAWHTFWNKGNFERLAWFWDARRLRRKSALPKAAFSTDTCPGPWATRPRATVAARLARIICPSTAPTCWANVRPPLCPAQCQDGPNVYHACLQRCRKCGPQSFPTADRQIMRQSSQHSMDCGDPAASAGWAWQDQWILRLSSKSECNSSLLC